MFYVFLILVIITAIFHYLKNGQTEEIIAYLKNIQKLATTFSSINKPTILELKGDLDNVAATCFTSLPFVTIGDNANIRFNEIDYNLTLFAGASYYLSRLPYE